MVSCAKTKKNNKQKQQNDNVICRWLCNWDGGDPDVYFSLYMRIKKGRLNAENNERVSLTFHSISNRHLFSQAPTIFFNCGSCMSQRLYWHFFLQRRSEYGMYVLALKLYCESKIKNYSFLTMCGHTAIYAWFFYNVVVNRTKPNHGNDSFFFFSQKSNKNKTNKKDTTERRQPPLSKLRKK